MASRGNCCLARLVRSQPPDPSFVRKPRPKTNPWIPQGREWAQHQRMAHSSRTASPQPAPAHWGFQGLKVPQKKTAERRPTPALQIDQLLPKKSLHLAIEPNSRLSKALPQPVWPSHSGPPRQNLHRLRHGAAHPAAKFAGQPKSHRCHLHCARPPPALPHSRANGAAWPRPAPL